MKKIAKQYVFNLKRSGTDMDTESGFDEMSSSTSCRSPLTSKKRKSTPEINIDTECGKEKCQGGIRY